jgi:hypothetical protein
MDGSNAMIQWVEPNGYKRDLRLLQIPATRPPHALCQTSFLCRPAPTAVGHAIPCKKEVLLKKMLPFLLAILAISACSYTTAEPVPFGDHRTSGFRFYEAKPLLVITPQSTTIVYVPDFERGYAATFGAILTKTHTDIKINNATLAEVSGDLDATGPLSGFFSYASTALQQGAKLGGVISENITGGVPGKYGVFEFEVNGTGQITGLHPITPPDFLKQLVDVPIPAAGGSPASGGGGAVVVPNK